MTERLRVGIIGCGEISGLNAWGYLTDDRADIHRMVDRMYRRVMRDRAQLLRSMTLRAPPP